MFHLFVIAVLLSVLIWSYKMTDKETPYIEKKRLDFEKGKLSQSSLLTAGEGDLTPAEEREPTLEGVHLAVLDTIKDTPLNANELCDALLDTEYKDHVLVYENGHYAFYNQAMGYPTKPITLVIGELVTWGFADFEDAGLAVTLQGLELLSERNI